MRIRASWLALGCGAYIAFAISLFPAGTAYRWFAPDTFRLGGIDGTVWSGSAELASVPGVPMRDLRWDLDALPLLLGRVSLLFEARLSDGFVRGEATVSPSVVSLRDLQASTSLAALDGPVQLRGARGLASLSLQTAEIRDGWPTALSGNLRLGQLQVPPLMPTGAAATLIPLGDFEVTLTGVSGQTLTANVRDTGGPLEVAATLSLQIARPYTLEGAIPRVDARVRPRANTPAELALPLDVLTVETDADGWRTLDLEPWLSVL